jgi:hypothetical protein
LPAAESISQIGLAEALPHAAFTQKLEEQVVVSAVN